MSIQGARRKTAVNPRLVLLALAAAVAIASVVLGTSLLRQNAKQHDLTSQLDSAEAVLARANDVRREAETLPARLAAADEELAAAQAAFPSELNSNGIMRTLLALANEHKVSVLSVDTIPPAAESPEETDRPTSLTYDLEVAGELAMLVRFVEALAERATNTTTISTFTLQQTDGRYVLDIELVAHARTPAGESSPSEDEGPTGEETGAVSEGEETPSE